MGDDRALPIKLKSPGVVFWYCTGWRKRRGPDTNSVFNAQFNKILGLIV